MLEPGIAAQAPDRRLTPGTTRSDSRRPGWPALAATALVATLAGAVAGYSIRGGTEGSPAGGAAASSAPGSGTAASAPAATPDPHARTPEPSFDGSISVAGLDPVFRAWLPSEIAGSRVAFQSVRQVDPAIGRWLEVVQAESRFELQAAAVLGATCARWQVSWASAETEAWRVVVINAPSCARADLRYAAVGREDAERIDVGGREVFFVDGGISGWGGYVPWRYWSVVPGRMWFITGPLREGRYLDADVHRIALEILATLPAPEESEE